MDPSTKEDEIVLVTGGSGYLGQHVVKLLHSQTPAVKEIRILDCVPYEPKLEFSESNKTVRIDVGDIRVVADVDKAVQGVTTVIHSAALVSFGTNPEIEAMEETNVNGTSHIIDACIRHNVPRLIFTSTVDAAIGCEEIIGGTECNTPDRPDTFLFPGYPQTKYTAEKMVLQANGKTLKNGVDKLMTLSLRLCVMFGELDPFYVTNGLKSAAERSGVLYRVGDCSQKMSQAYVGNCAWSHICAMNKMVSVQRQGKEGVREDMKDVNDDIGGRFYYITDDLPPTNSFIFMEHFLQPHGFRLSSYQLPYWLVYSLLSLRDLFLYVARPVYGRHNVNPARCSIQYVCSNYCFFSSRARLMLGYSPIYTQQQSLVLAQQYYSKLPL